MKIGIDASRAFGDQRTGIEEYSYQVVKGLVSKIRSELVLYVRPGDQLKIDFELPDNVRVEELSLMKGWTQLALSFQLLIDRIEILFVPAHTVPLIHPKKTIVTIHGLEYEHCPESYSWSSRFFHRFFIKKSCRWAMSLVAVSEKTKNDLVSLYNVPKQKIRVVYNGFLNEKSEEITGSNGFSKRKIGVKENQNLKINWTDFRRAKNHSNLKGSFFSSPVHGLNLDQSERFLLFIGRLEERKNVRGIIRAFEIIKKDLAYPGKLFLAGKPGTGYKKIKEMITNSIFSNQIVELGFVREDQKWELLKKTDCFLFPSFCEGFGIPILEAQSVGTPIITSNLGPMNEVAGDQSVLIDPKNHQKIANLINKILVNKKFKETIIKKGFKNIKRFSWFKCTEELFDVFKKIQ